VAGGARELVLTGIRLGAYSAGDGRGLEDLVSACLEVPGLARLRLSSIEPTDISRGLLQVIASDPRACPHLHIPLQSGSDGVLRRMGRRYSAAGYRTLIEQAREIVAGLAVTTDVLVGFPDETEDEFDQSVSFVRQIGFTRLHVFPYSRRAGTAAAGFSGQVPLRVRTERARVLGDVGRELSLKFHQGLVGSVQEVLVEREPENANGAAQFVTEGLTGQYVRVEVESNEPLRLGSLAMISVTGASAAGVRGLATGAPVGDGVDRTPTNA
jgi:threonylcarbamoyladenosine tRNA methylthiotransferase MtaB